MKNKISFIGVVSASAFLLAVVYVSRIFPMLKSDLKRPLVESGFSNDLKNIEKNVDMPVEPMKNDLKIFPPMDKVVERVSKKPFGILINPKTSPIQPERFSGYHTGIDLEIFPEENGTEVGVKFVCPGKIIYKNTVQGYGGVIVESCEIEGSPMTVVYGHLKLASIEKNMGDSAAAGEKLGILGDAYSAETDGERKHLHLGIHKGSGMSLSGYVRIKSELSNWIDPCIYLCLK